MPELTLQDIEQITIDIRRQEVGYSHLLEELVDHVCCDVENEMLKGLSFSEAYKIVLMKIGPDQFRQIQKDTLFAVDLNYRHMKSTMKISGIAGTILLSFAALFKIQHWPFAGIMMTLGAFALAFVFLPSSLGVLWKETHNRKRLFLFISAFITGSLFIAGTLFKVQHWPAAGIILLISFLAALFMFFPSIISMIFADEADRSSRGVTTTAALGAIIYIMGLLFKIQHWPFASMLLIIGIFVLAFIALPWFTWLRWKDETAITPKFIFLLLACLSIIVPGALISMNLQYGYQEGQYSNIERQEAFSDYLSQSNSQLISEISDTSDIRTIGNIHSKTISLLTHIDDLKIKMTVQAGEQTGISEFLIPGTVYRDELDGMINQYISFIDEFLPGHFTDIVDPFLVLPSADDKSISPLSGLNSLGLLGSSILTCENAALRRIQNNKNLSAKR
jgi:MFS family permease